MGCVPSFRGGRSSDVGTLTKPEGSKSPEKRDVYFALLGETTSYGPNERKMEKLL